MDWPGLAVRLRSISPGLLLPLILAVALGLRLYGIGWSDVYGFHPDERSIYMRADCMYDVLSETPGYAEGDCFRNNPGMEPGAPSIGAALDADRSPLNPHWFPLGSILIYLIVVVRLIFEPLTDLGSLLNMGYIGRSITAVADVGTVFMVYLLGKRMFSRRVGLLASALVAVAVVHIQHSHFYRPEPLQVFFMAVSFWYMLQVVERRRLRDSLLLGIFVGLTFAAKVSVLPLLLPLALAYAFRLYTTPEGGWSSPSPKEAPRVIVQALAGGAMAAVVFFITTPYALLDIFNFVGDIKYQLDNVAKTAGLVPFTVQYIGTTPFLYELKQTSVWGLGLPLGIVAWGGLLFTIVLAATRLYRTQAAPRGEILLLAWVVPSVIMLSLFEVKFLRYIFPVIPFLVLMGSGMLFWFLDRARELPPSSLGLGSRAGRARELAVRYAPHAVVGVIVLVVVATAFYGFAFERVYSRPHTAIQASEWINDNVPKHATIVTDNHWDEGIPNLGGYRVHGMQIPIYGPDSPAKMATIARLLSGGDYLVFYSNRTYGSVARLPDRYPLSSRYYRMLFSGELGYWLEKDFTSYPQLLGVSFVDDPFGRAQLSEPEALRNSRPGGLALNLGYADENVINYDHPRVLLFKNVGRLSLSHLLNRLTEKSSPRLGHLMSPLPEHPPGGSEEVPDLMLSPEQKAAQRSGGTWSDIIKRGSWTNKVPVLAWLLLVELIYLATLPLAIFLFRPLPDRGIVLARILGILAVAYVAWLLASIGWMDFSRLSVLVGILVVAGLSALVLAAQWRQIKAFLAQNWRLLTIGEVLFLVAFLSFVAIRWANPDLWHPFRGGEKPMDFAYLNAVLRSTVMPPYDPWFAGGYLNYYYWGQFVVATLIKATGIVPSVAYNLAVPLLFALTVTGAYSLVYNVAAGIRRQNAPISEGGGKSLPEGADPPLSPTEEAGTYTTGRWTRGVAWGPVAAGVVAGLFVAVIGNLDGFAQVVKGAWNKQFHGDVFPSVEYLSDFWRSSRMLPELGDVEPSTLAFWIPDKVVPVTELGPHITEFPFFSFLFADLHAHMIAIPFTLLAVGLGFSLLVGLREAGRWWSVLATTVLGAAVGALWAINSWDFPTYLILGVAMIGVGAYLRRGHWMQRLATFLVLAPLMGLACYFAFLPFHSNYHPFPTDIVVSKWQTPVPNFLGIHGLFLFLIGSFLLYLSWAPLRGYLSGLLHRRVDAQTPNGAWSAPALTPTGVKAVPWMALGGVVALFVFIYMGITGYWTAAMLVVFLTFVAWAVKRVLSDGGGVAPYLAFPLLLVTMALLVAIGVEFVRVQGDIGRMNTLFKYYLEVWVLLAMAAAYVLWYLASKGVFWVRWPWWPWLLRSPWMAALAVLLLSSFIYTVLGTWDRVVDRFDTQNMTLDGSDFKMTLDGADFMKRAVHWEQDRPLALMWDYQAIQELQDNVQGSPVVLEGWTFQYHWGTRITDYTGLPTVLGWAWHQEQQRMRHVASVRERIGHVTEIYSTRSDSRALELLRRYEVEYVVVGQLERAYYPVEGLGKFDRWTGTGLADLVYQNEGVKIYRGLWYN